MRQTMIIQDIDFGNCLWAAGSKNFFNSKEDRYWYLPFFSFIPGFEAGENITFVSKTTSFYSRRGNMPLDDHFRPENIKPKCIKIYFFKGMILNSVGLSGPGAEILLNTEYWQKITRPFFISFMAIASKPEDRILETERFVRLLSKKLEYFKTKIGLQINISCPNTEHNTIDLAKEALSILELASQLGLPLDLKVNTLIDEGIIREIENSKLCDVLTISNTLPYGTEGIDWKKLFGKKFEYRSPLLFLGGGGLSGKPILPLVLKKISDLRSVGITMPIKGSGGILSADDVSKMKEAGANAIEIGSVAILRPWRVGKIIERANEIF